MSVYDVDGTSIDVAYNLDGDNIAVVYDVDGNLISVMPFNDSATVTNIYTSIITSQPQGGCIDDSGNVYVVFYNTGKILKYNIQTGTSEQYNFTSNAYGHANDAAYCPITGMVYVVSMNVTGEIYELDPSDSMALNNTYIAKGRNGTATQIWCLAYDRIGNRFIAFDTNNDMLFYDTEFNLVSWKNIPNLSTIWPTTRQNIDTDGSFIYATSYNPNKICIMSMNGNLEKQVSCSQFSGEPEAICYDWENDVFYIEGIDSKYVIRQAEFRQTNS